MDLLEKIMQAKDLPVYPFEVEQWGVTVYIKTLSAAEYVAFVKRCDKLNPEEQMFLQVCMTVCDSAGTLLFDYDDKASVDKLKSKNIAAIQTLFLASTKYGSPSQKLIDELSKK